MRDSGRGDGANRQQRAQAGGEFHGTIDGNRPGFVQDIPFQQGIGQSIPVSDLRFSQASGAGCQMQNNYWPENVNSSFGRYSNGDTASTPQNFEQFARQQIPSAANSSDRAYMQGALLNQTREGGQLEFEHSMWRQMPSVPSSQVQTAQGYNPIRYAEENSGQRFISSYDGRNPDYQMAATSEPSSEEKIAMALKAMLKIGQSSPVSDLPNEIPNNDVKTTQQFHHPVADIAKDQQGEFTSIPSALRNRTPQQMYGSGERNTRPGRENHGIHNRSEMQRWGRDRRCNRSEPKCDLSLLNRELLSLLEAFEPTNEDIERRKLAVENVREILQEEWPQCQVHLYGSGANGFGLKSNDVDLCMEIDVQSLEIDIEHEIEDTNKWLADWESKQKAFAAKANEKSAEWGTKDEQYVPRFSAQKRWMELPEEEKLETFKTRALTRQVAKKLESCGMANVQALPHARVPVVKLSVPNADVDCDVCFNNMLAVENTKLLRDYSTIDPRLRQLVLVVKYWAKQRAVNDAYRGTLSSYCYVLMCIGLLQMRNPPILPCLQQMEPKTRKMAIMGYECNYFDKVDQLVGQSRNMESLGELVIAFFDYWAHGHDYVYSVCSVRLGHLIAKADKGWTKRVGSERHLVCIEDPFDTSHDLGRVVDKYSIRDLRDEFKRAHRILYNTTNPVLELFRKHEGRHTNK